MDAASASAAAEALEATLQADLVGLRAQLRTDVLDVDGQQDGHAAVVVVQDADECDADEALLAADRARLDELRRRAACDIDHMSEAERNAHFAELEAQFAEVQGEMLERQAARERSHASAGAAAGSHRRRRRRP